MTVYTWRIDNGDPNIFRLQNCQISLGPRAHSSSGLSSSRYSNTIKCNGISMQTISLPIKRSSCSGNAGKVYPKSKRLPVVEAAILIESKLKSYAQAILPGKGCNKSKIKDLRDELTSYAVLNLVLPLTLTKTDLRTGRYAGRPLIDRIRKIRNDIVHNNLSDGDIDELEVLDGIYAAVDLLRGS